MKISSQQMIRGLDNVILDEVNHCQPEPVNDVGETSRLAMDRAGYIFREEMRTNDKAPIPEEVPPASLAPHGTHNTEQDLELEKLKEIARKFSDILPSLEKLVVAVKNTHVSAEILMPTGEICQRLGIASTAKTLFQRTVAVSPDNSDALNYLGQFYFQNRKYREAERLFFKAFEASLDKVNWHMQAKENLLNLYSNYSQHLDISSELRKFCPCCEREFPRFLPFGIPPLRNVLCPQCNSLARHRLLWMYLKEKTNILKEPLHLLHFAPEGFLQEVLSRLPNISYLSADLFLPTAMVKMDITDITLEDNSVDVIICIHVLEHIVDDHKAMTELYRVLKPGGWALLQSPLDLHREKTYEDPSIVSPEDRYRHFGQADHVRWYGRDYKDRLENAGFSVNVDRYVKELDDEIIQRFGLDIREDIYFCSK